MQTTETFKKKKLRTKKWIFIKASLIVYHSKLTFKLNKEVSNTDNDNSKKIQLVRIKNNIVDAISEP